MRKGNQMKLVIGYLTILKKVMDFDEGYSDDERWEDIPLYANKEIIEQFFYAEIRSFEWMYEKWKEGKIRTKTITNLIPMERIQKTIDTLSMREQYEKCSVLQNIIVDIYIGEEIQIMLDQAHSIVNPPIKK